MIPSQHTPPCSGTCAKEAAKDDGGACNCCANARLEIERLTQLQQEGVTLTLYWRAEAGAQRDRAILAEVERDHADAKLAEVEGSIDAMKAGVLTRIADVERERDAALARVKVLEGALTGTVNALADTMLSVQTFHGITGWAIYRSSAPEWLRAVKSLGEGRAALKEGSHG